MTSGTRPVWVQLTTDRDLASQAAPSRQRKRRVAAPIISAAAAVCLVVVVIVLVFNSSTPNETSSSLLGVRHLYGGDKELATIDRALALESRRDPHSRKVDKPKALALKSAESNGQSEKMVAKADTQLLANADHHWSHEMHAIAKEYQKKIKEEKIKTMNKLQNEEQVALNAVHHIKVKGNEAVDRLTKAENRAETAIAAQKEEQKLNEQLVNVEKAAEHKKLEIESKIKAIRSSVQSSPSTGTVDVSKPDSAPTGKKVKRKEADITQKQIQQLEDQVAALHTKKLAVRAKVSVVEKEQQAARSVVNSAHQTAQAGKSVYQAVKGPRDAKPPSAHTVQNSPPKKVPVQSATASAVTSNVRSRLCTRNNCDISAEDKTAVTNGASIHKLSEVLDGNTKLSDKQKALREVKALQHEIRSDYEHVQSFALHQEHVLDQARRQTAAELGRKVELAVEKSLSNGPTGEMKLMADAHNDEKI